MNRGPTALAHERPARGGHGAPEASAPGHEGVPGAITRQLAA
ncbi:uncharacterized protein AruCF_1847 [Achromobacter ruhlandii]|nr:uncharacterized protein AruCF_1847 [Achromobacter ruhlandii]